LFFKYYRIAEVDESDRFDFQIDESSTNLEIAIAGQSGKRKFYYNLLQGTTRDSPWPIGPVTLLAPKPEPIPPDVLATLRAELGLKADESVPTGGIIKESESIDSNTNADRQIWQWVALACILLMLPICFLLWKARAKGSKK